MWTERPIRVGALHVRTYARRRASSRNHHALLAVRNGRNRWQQTLVHLNKAGGAPE